jgi:glycosyltransferase involved in cell wall biosynthesis
MSNKEYLLSIRLMTYMHENYIKQAMDGIMMQQTNFQIEVVVGDDLSTDRTLDIIRTYSDTQNIHIRILKREKGDTYWNKRQKLGRLYNFFNILVNCSGEYVALLDGDDYWTDPNKLQKQVDFLDAHPDFSLCHHRVDKLNDNNIETWDYCPYEETDIYDLARGNHISTLSCVFRNRDFHYDLQNINLGDYYIHLMNAEHGRIKFFNNTMGLYRVGVGMWSSDNEVNTKSTMLALLDELKTRYSTNQKLIDCFNKQKTSIYLRLAELMLSENNHIKSQSYFELAKSHNPNETDYQTYAKLYNQDYNNLNKTLILNYVRKKLKL